MKNFGRVLRMSLAYRMTVVVSIICALLVGVLWGANISASFPIIRVTLQGISLQEGLREQIAESEALITSFEQELVQLAGDADNDATAAEARSRLDAERKAVARYRWLLPRLERYAPSGAFATLVALVGLGLIGTILKGFFVIGQTVLVHRLANLATYHLRTQFYRNTLKLDLAHFTHEGTADLISRFTHDIEQITLGLVVLFGKMVREPLKMAVCLIGAGMICWRLLLLSLILAPLAGLLIRLLARTLKRANRRAMEEMARLYGVLEETLGGIKIVKAFTMERTERKRFHDGAKDYYRRAMKIARYDSLSHPVIEVMGVLTISLALLGGAYLVLSEQTHLLGIRMSERPLQLDSLLWFFGLLAGAVDPARKLSDVVTKLQRASAASDRVYALLDRQPEIRDPDRPVPLGRHDRDLVFEGVHFAYQSDHPVLNGIDLTIPFGRTVAIIGPSGCGKSTLVNLIGRFADPTAGQIRVDGIALSDIRPSELRGQIGLVTQDPFLFDDTVAANIRYGSPRATNVEVIDAAKQAQAHAFIKAELPDGYQSMVGPGGAQLSGGQRQRICLARAILRNPSILILDEATSQIDLQSEQIIHRVLEQFLRGRTGVIITHRLGALALAEQIVVMEEGRVLDVGTHEELSVRCDYYQRLSQIDKTA